MKTIKIILAIFLIAFVYAFTKYCIYVDREVLIIINFIPLLMLICLFVEGVAEYIQDKLETLN
jgi:hypothetical protein